MTLDELIVTWRARQLKAYGEAHDAPGKGPIHARPAMLVSVAIARCANELAAWQRQHVTTKDTQKGNTV